MMRHYLRQRGGRCVVAQRSVASSLIVARLLQTQCPYPRLLVTLPSSTLLRCRVSLIAYAGAARKSGATPPPSLLQQRRSVSASYTAAVPCARFNVCTKNLARITNQPTLPPAASVYIIDVRKKHLKNKKKPNTRRIMSQVIDAHRAEKTKAAVETDAGDANAPPLIFLVKTDDTAKRAARRQVVMQEQLNALGALGEFRVCVLTGPKSRRWSEYVAGEKEAADGAAVAAAAAAVTPPPPAAAAATPAASEEGANGRGSIAAGVAAAAAGAGGAVVATLSNDAHLFQASCRENVKRTETADTANVLASTQHEANGNVSGTAGEGEEEEEWEEVEVEVEEDEAVDTDDHAEPSPPTAATEVVAATEVKSASADTPPSAISTDSAARAQETSTEGKQQQRQERRQESKSEEALVEFDIDGLIAADADDTTITAVPPVAAAAPAPAVVVVDAIDSAAPPESASDSAAQVLEHVPAMPQEVKQREEAAQPSPVPTPQSSWVAEVYEEAVKNASDGKSAASVVLEAPVESAELVESMPAVSPPSPPPPPPPPQPLTPMPVYPDVPARLYHGASTIYLSDRALRELPVTANVLVIDHLDWSDDTIADIDAALDAVDPVAGHVLLYRDAYVPQVACVVKENLVFREVLLPFIFAFRTNLSQAEAQVQQRRFVEALRSRPTGLSHEQQALLAGQKDRSFVCVLCAEESRRGGENPLDDPQRRHRSELATTPSVAVDSTSSWNTHENDVECHDALAHEREAATADVMAAGERDPSDALQRLWAMMNVSTSSPIPGFSDSPKKSHDSGVVKDRDKEEEEEKERPAGNSPPTSRPGESKKHFSVPVPTYEVEEDDLADYGVGGGGGAASSGSAKGRGNGAGGSAWSRRGKNARSFSSASSYDAASAPPTSLPPKQAPPPLSLGLLGFEKVVFGKPNAYAYLDTAYGQREKEMTRAGAGRGGVTQAAAKAYASTEANHEAEEEERHANTHDSADDDGDDAHADAALTSADAAAGPDASGSAIARVKGRGSKGSSSAASRTFAKTRGTKDHRSRGARKKKTVKQREVDVSAAVAAAVAEAQAEDAALEDFILSLYKDSNTDDGATGGKSTKASRRSRGGLSSVSSARLSIKSAGRKKRKLAELT
ncbi:hypothetical protein NQL31_001334 [Lotmaria passim]